MVSPTFFRRLAVVTALFAYLQIALGGVVRVTGSGLGCPDWPLCHGRPYPPANLPSIIEYTHRAVGSVTGLFVIATVVLAWMVFRARRPVVTWLASAALVAYGSEGLLGGIVVHYQLPSWVVLVHLSLAMIILGLLVATAMTSMPASAGIRDASFRGTAAVTAGATYVLLLTGSTVVASGADERCHTWPLCGSGLSPSFVGVDAFTMLHRGAVLLIGILIVYVAIQAMRRPQLRAAGVATMVVFLLQVAVGAGAALTDGPLFNGLHVAIATLVWAGTLSIPLLALERVDREPAFSRLTVDKGPA